MSGNSIRLQSRPARLRAVSFAGAADAIGAITPGCRVVGINKGQFSMLDLLHAVLEQVGPADVTVSTWTQGKADIRGVEGLLRTQQITRFRLLIDRSFVTRHPDYVRLIHRIAGPESVRQTKTHAKFALIAAGNYRITIRTSMNFNRNPRLEQFDLDDDGAIYVFFMDMVDRVFAAVPAGLLVTGHEVEQGFAGLNLEDSEWEFSDVDMFGN